MVAKICKSFPNVSHVKNRWVNFSINVKKRISQNCRKHFSLCLFIYFQLGFYPFTHLHSSIFMIETSIHFTRWQPFLQAPLVHVLWYVQVESPNMGWVKTGLVMPACGWRSPESKWRLPSAVFHWQKWEWTLREEKRNPVCLKSKQQREALKVCNLPRSWNMCVLKITKNIEIAYLKAMGITVS